MQGKLSIYGALPKVARLRSRVEKPSKELTSQLRAAFNDVVVDVLNKSTFEIRTAMIKKVNGLGLKYKNKQHEAQVMSAINDIFDSVFASTNDELRQIVGTDEEEAPAEAAAEETKAPAAEETKAPAEDDSEFSE